MKRILLTIVALSCAFLLQVPSKADLIPITGYDINDAVMSGHGNWAHTYNGNIIPGVNFDNFGWAGTTATYNGVGSGTLNDGVIGNSTGNSQLFINGAASDGTVINPAIFLTLSQGAFIDEIEIFGGDLPGNGIPGEITGVTVHLLDTNFNLHSQAFATTPFGINNANGTPVNDLVTLTGSSLDGIPAVAVFLDNFQGQVANWISITEIQLQGREVPEPGTFGILAAVGVCGLLYRRRR